MSDDNDNLNPRLDPFLVRMAAKKLELDGQAVQHEATSPGPFSYGISNHGHLT